MLVELEADAVPEAGTPLFELDAEASTLAGPGGCNRPAGRRRSRRRRRLPPGPMTTTSRACDHDIVRREATFLAVLEAPTGIERDAFELTRLGDGRVLARLARAPGPAAARHRSAVRLVRCPAPLYKRGLSPDT